MAKADLVFVTPDVEDHVRLKVVDDCLQIACNESAHDYGKTPVVLASQVPPGYTRKWARKFASLYYQVDTIIMNKALRRATFPERIVVGVEDNSYLGDSYPFDDAYQQWLDAFECPVFPMSYESAEMVKLAVNYYLAKQVETTNTLAAVAQQVGANWDDMIPALRADYRIGSSYIVPGTIDGSHLVRDVKTIDEMIMFGMAKAARRVGGGAGGGGAAGSAGYCVGGGAGGGDTHPVVSHAKRADHRR